MSWCSSEYSAEDGSLREADAVDAVTWALTDPLAGAGEAADDAASSGCSRRRFCAADIWIRKCAFT
jgi:hypothetical protein